MLRIYLVVLALEFGSLILSKYKLLTRAIFLFLLLEARKVFLVITAAITLIMVACDGSTFSSGSSGKSLPPTSSVQMLEAIVNNLTAVPDDSTVYLNWEGQGIEMDSFQIIYHRVSTLSSYAVVGDMKTISVRYQTIEQKKYQHKITSLVNNEYYMFMVIPVLNSLPDNSVVMIYEKNVTIAIGPDYDNDEIINRDDEDDDNDKIIDINDQCSLGAKNWISNSSTDYDGDGCRNDEDSDQDNDQVLNPQDACPINLASNWISNASTDYDADGCRNDEDSDQDNDQVINDQDSCPINFASNWISNATSDGDTDGCRDLDEDDFLDFAATEVNITGAVAISPRQANISWNDPAYKGLKLKHIRMTYQGYQISPRQEVLATKDSINISSAKSISISNMTPDLEYEFYLTAIYESPNFTSGVRGRSAPARVIMPGDSDNDNIANSIDNCPAVYNPNQNDYDGDGRDPDALTNNNKGGDACDGDQDNDKVLNAMDSCPINLAKNWISNTSTDYDGDGCRNDEDSDQDNDQVLNPQDACPINFASNWISNASTDYDADGCRNDEDSDQDNDQVLNPQDACPINLASNWISNASTDYDADGCRNDEDSDQDNDQVLNPQDACPINLASNWISNTSTDYDGDGCRNDEDSDQDNDKVLNLRDSCPINFASNWISNTSTDYDGDGCRNDEDSDQDNDQVLNLRDSCPINFASNWISNTTTDYDGDGCRNDEDSDQDNDQVLNLRDSCPINFAKNWISNATSDGDTDGCRDLDEDDFLDFAATAVNITEAVAISPRQVNISWNDPAYKGLKLKHIRMTYQGYQISPRQEVLATKGSINISSARSISISNMTPDLEYEFYLTAIYESPNFTNGVRGRSASARVIMPGDSDNDNIANSIDNCPAVYNPNQNDYDGDGRDPDALTNNNKGGDACDSDQDNDQVLNPQDACPINLASNWISNTSTDYDGDGCRNDEDSDQDNDQVLNLRDSCPINFASNWISNTTTDYDGDGCRNDEDSDQDNDQVLNLRDSCPINFAKNWISNATSDGDTDGCRDLDEDDFLDFAATAVNITEAVAISPRQVNISWNDPAYKGLKLKHIRMTYQGYQISPRQEVLATKGSINISSAKSISISNMTPDLEYEFYLTAIYESPNFTNGVRGRSASARVIMPGDSDNDNIANSIDNCPAVYNPNQNDYDGDGRDPDALTNNNKGGDACDSDQDNDQVLNDQDSCPINFARNWISNASTDYDGDGCRNDEDSDRDNDQVLNLQDACPINFASNWISNASTDYDADGCRNDEDSDQDNDQVLNPQDACPINFASNWISNTTSDGDTDGCRDLDEDDFLDFAATAVNITEAVAISPSQVNISWNDPVYQGLKLKHIRMTYQGYQINPRQEVLATKGSINISSARSISISRMTPDLEYEFYLTAIYESPNFTNGVKGRSAPARVFMPGDSDNDNIANSIDNCPAVYNPNQNDYDGDGRDPDALTNNNKGGDACDNDQDNDQVLNPQDACPINLASNWISNTSTDYDGDGCRNDEDSDQDNDQVLNPQDACPINFASNWISNASTDGDTDGCRDLDEDDFLDFAATAVNITEAVAISPSQVNISWNNPAYKGLKLKHIRMTYQGYQISPRQEVLATKDSINISSAKSISISNMTPDLEYEFYLTAIYESPNFTSGVRGRSAPARVFMPGDSDNDNIANSIDNCPSVYNPNQNDYDGDGRDPDALTNNNKGGDACDNDQDNDQVLNPQDACPINLASNWISNTSTDYDGDGCRNDEDSDQDNDQVLNPQDACPINLASNWISNTTTDYDGDGCRNDEDSDQDNDKVLNPQDSCPINFAKNWISNTSTDYDGDGCRNDEDSDQDNDQVLNPQDACPINLASNWISNTSTDYDGDGCRNDEDSDRDNDQVLNPQDACPINLASNWISNATTDYDGDGCRNDEDSDDDNDRVLDADDKYCPFSPVSQVYHIDLDKDRDGCLISEDIDDDADLLIEIRNADDLNNIRYNLQGTNRTFADGTSIASHCGNLTSPAGTKCIGYELVVNINPLADGYDNWRPIGSCRVTTKHPVTRICDQSFKAVLEGNNYKITNLNISYSDNSIGPAAGLFAAISKPSVIRNLNIENSTIFHDSSNLLSEATLGNLAGYVNGVDIMNVSVNNSFIRTDPLNPYSTINTIGGLIGEAYNSSILHTSIDIKDISSGSFGVGGIIGYADNSKLISSYAKVGSIKGRGSVGGLIGKGEKIKIYASYFLGNKIQSTRTEASGGLIGGITDDSIVKSSYVSLEEIEIYEHIAAGIIGYGDRNKILNSYVSIDQMISQFSSWNIVISPPLDPIVINFPPIDQVPEYNRIYYPRRMLDHYNDIVNNYTHTYWDDKLILATWGGLITYESDTSRNKGNASTAKLKNTDHFTSSSSAGPDDIYVDWDRHLCDPISGEFFDLDDFSVTEQALLKSKYPPVWDLRGPNEYPALRCTPGGVERQKDIDTPVSINISLDTDGDSIINSKDNCPLIYNRRQENTDLDLLGNACDDMLDGSKGIATNIMVVPSSDPFNLTRAIMSWTNPKPILGLALSSIRIEWQQIGGDSSGIVNLTDRISLSDSENRSYTVNKLVEGTSYNFIITMLFDANRVTGESQTVSTSLFSDTDMDRILDHLDNCPTIPNPSQKRTNGNSLGDACDSDKDGIHDADDYCDMNGPKPSLAGNWRSTIFNDNDQDGCRDHDEDNDDDNDGILDINDSEPKDPSIVGDIDGDGRDAYIDIDADGDGLIEIYNATMLDWMRHNLQGTSITMAAGETGDTTGCGGNSSSGIYITACAGYELVDDIDLSAYSSAQGWEPIASCHSIPCYDSFNTNFVGNGHNINRMTINLNHRKQGGIGLFGALSPNASIHNFNLLNAEINSTSHTSHIGLLAGYADNARISNVSVTGEINARSSSSVGGLVGQGRNTRISFSSAQLDKLEAFYIGGGLVGDASDSMITSSYAGTNILSGLQFVGGLVGIANRAQIDLSYAKTGTIENGDSYLGGLVGYGSQSVITSSYAETKNINQGSVIGGLVGYGSQAMITSSYAASTNITGQNTIGGLVGDGSDSIINSSYAVMYRLLSNANVGGLVGGGSKAPISIKDSYYTFGLHIRAPSAQHIQYYGEPKSHEDLYLPTSFSGIYMSWGDNWCDPNTGGLRTSITSPGNNYVQVWSLNTQINQAFGFPALSCLINLTPDQQRTAITSALSGN